MFRDRELSSNSDMLTEYGKEDGAILLLFWELLEKVSHGPIIEIVSRQAKGISIVRAIVRNVIKVKIEVEM